MSIILTKVTIDGNIYAIKAGKCPKERLRNSPAIKDLNRQVRAFSIFYKHDFLKDEKE